MMKRIAILLLATGMGAGLTTSSGTMSLARTQDDKMESQDKAKMKSDKMEKTDKMGKKTRKHKKDKMDKMDKMTGQSKMDEKK